MTTLALRDYQIEAIAAVRGDWKGVDRTLVVMATGTGKTQTFLGLLDAERRAGTLTRALIIAHRRELIYQPIQRALEFFPALGAEMGVVMADQNEVHARHIVATIQTLVAGNRVEQILAHGPISHIIIDECHHATAETYQRLVAAFPGAKVLGVTATPLRTDGDGLAKVFQRVSYRLPISAAIARGSLAPFDALGVALPVSVAELRETENGWEAESLGNLLRAENVLAIVFEKWQEFCSDRQTIGFTASVAQARETAEYFSAQGVAANWVSGETPKRERDAILKYYQRGDLKVVFNCMVLTEGFDAPETSAVLMIAPTKSDLIYVQRLGRGLRLAAGKADCRVLDFAPVEDRNVVMAGDVLGKPREVKKAEEQAQRQGVLFALSIDRMGQSSAIDPAKLIVKVLNLLKKDALAWTVGADFYATAALGTESLCIALPNAERMGKAEGLKRCGQWGPGHSAAYDWLSQFRLYRVNGSARFVGLYPTMDAAKAAADCLALDGGTLGNKKSDWRRKDITTKQRLLLARLGVPVPDGCTSGQAAQLITHAIVSRSVDAAEHTKLRALFHGQQVTA
jgi:superfamily II DNA or RNA helicase